MSRHKQELASESARASEQEVGVLTHLPASFRVLAEFALQEKRGEAHE